jgi:hypothetical protein
MPRKHKKHGEAKQASSTIAKTISYLKTSTADNRIYTRRIPYAITITSNALGIINNVLNLNPLSAPDWASMSNLYDEFRVIGIALTLVPRTTFSVTQPQNMVIVALDNDSSTVQTSYEQTAEYNNRHIFPSVWTSERALKFTFARPTAGSENTILWYDVATPASSPGAVVLYSEALGTTVTYFKGMLEYIIEFRGTR